MQFLIDECLTVRLVDVAVARGYRASHIAHIGRPGAMDWDLMPLILENDWTFVTRNAVDFRGPKDRVVKKGLYAGVDLHAGLVCLVGEPMGAADQVELFEAALAEIADAMPINLRIEVGLAGDEITVEVYSMP